MFDKRISHKVFFIMYGSGNNNIFDDNIQQLKYFWVKLFL
jgi:hypothetical protein